MNRAAAVEKLYVLVRTFLSDIAAQVAVGNKEYVFSSILLMIFSADELVTQTSQIVFSSAVVLI